MPDDAKQEATSLEFAPVGAPCLAPAPVNVVGLHGFGGAAAAFAPVAAALTGEVRVWSADLYGHRGRAWPAGADDFDELLRDFTEAVLRVPTPRYLLAYSMGARLGLAAWVNRDDLFRGGALVGVHPGLTTEAERAARADLDRDRAARLRRLGPRAFFREWDANPLFRGRDTRSLTWRADHEDGLARCFEVLSLARQPALGDALSQRVADGRAWVVVGDRDEKFRRLLAPWSPRILPGPHDLLTENPTALAELVRAHLSTPAIRG